VDAYICNIQNNAEIVLLPLINQQRPKQTSDARNYVKALGLVPKTNTKWGLPVVTIMCKSSLVTVMRYLNAKVVSYFISCQKVEID